ncbi:4-hydroxy-tetrahydrodipicolinate synthase [Diaphorobacter aerolatus]|uniref:4-hydroxy-tetrahydrodipicolinate synthase n=1 Tax=Diaphorobacter aerolatus TaxID=1288495 RepID=A0A7H0GN16_9BURK|nr:4-hydroxy-tetrahydrodipicolinate synthase [Diaphorobacter aerolatus]QNP49682.1 4-hydroxy-tetrahydrodipicolinate synthase [Diaphorobacter aerolatus]
MPSSHQSQPSTTDFSGLWIPLVTPFRDDAVDHDALHALAVRMRQAGIAGFCACGSTGEAAALSHDEEDAVLSTILDAAGGLPVMMGAADCHLGRMLERVQQLNSRALAALLVPAPTYIRPSQEGLMHWFTRIADASAHPIVIYDIPYRTGATLELATLRALARHPNIVAIKDCGGDAAKTQRLIDEGALQVLAGEDVQIFTSLALGARGAIAASAHAHTDHFVALLRLLSTGQLGAARALWAPLQQHIRASFAEPNPAPIKGWLARQGWMTAELRAPMTPASSAVVDQLCAIQLPQRPRDAQGHESD